MAIGRPPIPTHLKILRGNPGGKSRINQNEPKPTGELSDAPTHFDQEMREVWNYAIEHAPRGLLKKLDASVLEAWCASHVLHRRALGEVRKHGMLMKAPNTGLPIQSPYLPVVNKQALIMMRAIDHLGFSPASRTRIQVGDSSTKAIGGWDEVAEDLAAG